MSDDISSQPTTLNAIVENARGDANGALPAGAVKILGVAALVFLLPTARLTKFLLQTLFSLTPPALIILGIVKSCELLTRGLQDSKTPRSS